MSRGAAEGDEMTQRLKRLKVLGLQRREGEGNPVEETDKASGGWADH